MAKRRALTEAAADPTARKQPRVVVEPNPAHREVGHVVLAVFVGFAVGLVGGILSSRILRIL